MSQLDGDLIYITSNGYPAATRVTSKGPLYHIKESKGDHHSAMYALFSLSGGTLIKKANMNAIVTNLNSNQAYHELSANGNYSARVIEHAVRALKLTYVTLPTSEELKSQQDVDIIRCIQMPNLAGFLVCQAMHYLAYVVIPGQTSNTKEIYNCDSANNKAEKIPSARHLQQELVCRRCNGEVVMAVFRAS